jgi:hypothetical protein
VFFRADSLEALPPVAFFADACHGGAKGWQVEARTDCAMQPISFLLEGPEGDYAGADKIAAAIIEWLEEKKR